MNLTEQATSIVAKIKNPSQINFMNKTHRLKLWNLIDNSNPDTLTKNNTNQLIYDEVRVIIKKINGDTNKGVKNINSKLTDKMVIDIYKSDISNKELAKLYDISISTISAIKTDKSWTHLTKTLK